jgi:hypothetical protein
LSQQSEEQKDANGFESSWQLGFSRHFLAVFAVCMVHYKFLARVPEQLSGCVTEGRFAERRAVGPDERSVSGSHLPGSRFFFCQCEAAAGISVSGLTLHASERKNCIMKIRYVKSIGGVGHQVEARDLPPTQPKAAT